MEKNLNGRDVRWKTEIRIAAGLATARWCLTQQAKPCHFRDRFFSLRLLVFFFSLKLFVFFLVWVFSFFIARPFTNLRKFWSLADATTIITVYVEMWCLVHQKKKWCPVAQEIWIIERSRIIKSELLPPDCMVCSLSRHISHYDVSVIMTYRLLWYISHYDIPINSIMASQLWWHISSMAYQFLWHISYYDISVITTYQLLWHISHHRILLAILS